MQIGAVAKKVGLSIDAIRFYERKALLPRPARTTGGFRQYSDSDLQTLGFIRGVQGLGFTLREVRELLDLRQRSVLPCTPVRRRLEQKLASVQRKLTDLKKLEHELCRALHRCNLEKYKCPARCPLLGEIKPRKSESTQ